MGSISKNNMGGLMTIILVVLLSQPKYFNFLINDVLGRILLLAAIIFTGYTNKITGLIAVLCVIIAFNYNGQNIVHAYEGFETKEKDNKPNEKATTEQSTKNTNAREGFCMSDRETNMLRGKQSNSVAVFNNSREQSDDVSPSDNSVFSGDYASI